jgi:hypothetical protein
MSFLRMSFPASFLVGNAQTQPEDFCTYVKEIRTKESLDLLALIILISRYMSGSFPILQVHIVQRRMKCRHYDVSNRGKPETRPNDQKKVVCSVCGIRVLDQKQLSQYMPLCTRHTHSRDAVIVDSSGTSTCVDSKRRLQVRFL